MSTTVTPGHVIAVGVCLPALATLFVALRLFTRYYRVKNGISVDDWLIVAAWVLCVGLGVMMIVGGSEIALAQPTPSNSQPKGYAQLLNNALVIAEKMRFVNNLTSVVALGLVKCSVIFFYRRIFVGKIFNIVSWSLFGIVVAWTITYSFGTIFECGTRLWANWSTLDALLTYCTAHQDMQRSMALSDVVTDVLILAVPVPLVFRLQMSLERKIAVSVVFLLGAIAIAASVTRVTILWIQTTDFWDKPGGNLLVSTLIYWTMVELGLSISAACLPTLRPLVSSRTIEQSIASVRSAFSLQSFQSRGSARQNSKTSEKLYGKHHAPSRSTVDPPLKENGPTTDIYAMNDMEDMGEVQHPNGITVKRDTVMREERTSSV